MSRPPVVPAEDEILVVLQRAISIAEAARRENASEQAIGNWKREFLEGGKTGIEAGRSTSRFCRLIDMPERRWRRWQAKTRADLSLKGPCPRPVRVTVRDVVVRHAKTYPAWGHREAWAMARHDGHSVSQATMLRLLRDEGLILGAGCQRERRKLAKRRKAAFATEPTGPDQVW